MKKQIFKSTVLGSVILISTQIVAQKKNETSAAVAYKNTYSLAMGKNNIEGAKKALLDAKTYVDLAAENSETQNSPKTLWLKGEIYSNLFLFSYDKSLPFYFYFFGSEFSIRSGKWRLQILFLTCN